MYTIQSPSGITIVMDAAPLSMRDPAYDCYLFTGNKELVGLHVHFSERGNKTGEQEGIVHRKFE